MADQVRSWLRTPTAVAAGSAALFTLAAMVAVGLVVAVLTPDNSLLGRAGAGSGLFKEIIRDTVGTTQARLGFASLHFTVLPITFALVPVLGAAVGVRRNGARTEGLPPRQRLIVAAATGIPLSVLVLIVAAFGSKSGLGFSSLSVIFFCLLWGGLGGVAGMWRVIGVDALAREAGAIPPAAARWLRLTATALKPLAALLVVCGVIGVFAWEVQVIRGQETAKLGRGAATALIETPFLVGEYAIEDLGLGTFAKFQPPGEESSSASFPLPADDHGSFDAFAKRFRIFAYHHVYPLVIYLLALALLVGATLVFMAYAGYVTASASGARAVGPSVAYGALVGAVWAVAAIILRALANVQNLVGDSLFVSLLLVGAVAGAAGGLLAACRPATPPALAG